MALRIDERKTKVMMARAGIDTMEQMADLAGISTKTLYNYFQGEAFRSSVVNKLGEALNCSPIDLLGDSGNIPPKPGSPGNGREQVQENEHTD